ncbi:hypothetical protein [Actinocorallia longicatena]|uniref:Uncharacterized protein n=1 Tax=Actinocorallia longicatena TaxID=111803 RepID=A0ABP6QKE8_9ACTN
MRTYRTLMALAGVAVIGYGLYGLLDDPYIGDPLDIAIWAGSGVVIHDGLWLPLVCLVGAFAVRGPVLRGGLIIAASLTVVALPAVLREDDDQGNPTLLPLHYQRNLLILLACVALGTGAAWTFRRLRARRARANRRTPAPKAGAPRR